jgi:hypothetical protein
VRFALRLGLGHFDTGIGIGIGARALALALALTDPATIQSLTKAAEFIE